MKVESFYPPRNFAAIPAEAASFERARVAIVPVPYDGTTEYKAALRGGPQAIIDASQDLELFDIELERDTYLTGIHTLPELQPLMGGPEHMIQRVYETARDLLRMGKMPVMLGGEHSVTLGMVRAFLESAADLSVLQLDAHTDLRQEYLGTPFSYASVMRRVYELCPMVQVGIRSMSREEHTFIKEHGLSPFWADSFDPSASSGHRVRDTIEQVVSALSPNVYLTVDLDVFDPGVMPAVGAPEPGGLGWAQVTALLREVTRRRRVLGFDVVELCPKEGPVACAFLAAKLIYKVIGYVTSQDPTPRP